MPNMFYVRITVLASLLSMFPVEWASAEVDASRAVATPLATHLTALQSAKAGGDQDQSPLAEAWRGVSSADVTELPVILAAFDAASPLGVNWLSSALDEVLRGAALRGEAPADDGLIDFVLDTSHGVVARETAIELLRLQNDEAARDIVKELLHDPSERMRRPAVEDLIRQATAEEDSARRLEIYKRAFEAALDEDQVVRCVVAMRSLGHSVDHIRKFGLLMHWQILGPFDYANGKGFDTAYPPESLNLETYEDPEIGIYSGKTSQANQGNDSTKLVWKTYVNTARDGVVDLNKAIAKLRDAVAYGAAVFENDKDQEIEFRLRQQNPCKLWLNGQLIYEQPIGHTGNFFDQYRVPAKLRKGANLIIIKSCQWAGPAELPFFETWQFGVRVVDKTGTAVLSVNRPATPELDPLPGSTAEIDVDSESEASSDAENDVSSDGK